MKIVTLEFDPQISPSLQYLLHHEFLIESLLVAYSHAVFLYCVQDSLCFPDDVSSSADVKDLIQGLLTEPSCRLSYDSIKNHQFFQTTNWDDLLSCKLQCTVYWMTSLPVLAMYLYMALEVADHHFEGTKCVVNQQYMYTIQFKDLWF